jgi:hypothetical protein
MDLENKVLNLIEHNSRLSTATLAAMLGEMKS